jgi:hypothetical protein
MPRVPDPMVYQGSWRSPEVEPIALHDLLVVRLRGDVGRIPYAKTALRQLLSAAVMGWLHAAYRTAAPRDGLGHVDRNFCDLDKQG